MVDIAYCAYRVHSSDHLHAADLTSLFPSSTKAHNLLFSMDTQPSFKQGEPSPDVTTLLENIQSADPKSSDIDEDNRGQGWGHYQFTAGGISPSSVLTAWQNIGSVATAFKLVAAALKTSQDARAMCANAETPKTSGFISDIYLNQILDCLEKCWVDAGGVRINIYIVRFVPQVCFVDYFLDHYSFSKPDHSCHTSPLQQDSATSYNQSQAVHDPEPRHHCHPRVSHTNEV